MHAFSQPPASSLGLTGYDLALLATGASNLVCMARPSQMRRGFPDMPMPVHTPMALYA